MKINVKEVLKVIRESEVLKVEMKERYVVMSLKKEGGVESESEGYIEGDKGG